MAIAGLITACSSHSPPPTTFATGYVGDRAVVRVWRKDDSQQHSTQLVTLSNALQDDNLWPNLHGVETRYLFVQDHLREIKRSYRGAHPESLHLRFADDGTVSFMQRQLDDRRESVSDDEIALFQFDAKRVLELSEVLRTGSVKLRQGVLKGNRVLTCDGQNVSPDFDLLSLRWIAEQRQHSPDVTLRVAWLDAPAGRNCCWWLRKTCASGSRLPANRVKSTRHSRLLLVVPAYSFSFPRRRESLTG